ncbi:hypothetical protein BO83DRAFT_29726 [Aspergillus eucalypticola CBS 122712]|uniref:Secreted protein n=1 Tax=Aspergillus eucalypticola (strain CBS 122712 / IBT 29274) TaxID=1448314 RepID=A0A317VK55_ASPEC|nr:uncharacterized protein BO83DRAFT_29726 [Aspergillus eucalypticola CBS 122712]PWY73262.1 hypothetical protein BO83DRAFT_29726 [Aspergillus eucalypticola CBS 122712]
MNLLIAVYAVALLLTHLHNTSHNQVPGVYLVYTRVHRVFWRLFVTSFSKDGFKAGMSKDHDHWHEHSGSMMGRSSYMKPIKLQGCVHSLSLSGL